MQVQSNEEQDKSEIAQEARLLTSISSNLLRSLMIKGIEALDHIIQIHKTLKSWDMNRKQMLEAIEQYDSKNYLKIICWKDEKDDKHTRDMFSDVLENKSCKSSNQKQKSDQTNLQNIITKLKEEIVSLKDKITIQQSHFKEAIEKQAETLHQEYQNSKSRLIQQHINALQSKEKQISRLHKSRRSSNMKNSIEAIVKTDNKQKKQQKQQKIVAVDQRLLVSQSKEKRVLAQKQLEASQDNRNQSNNNEKNHDNESIQQSSNGIRSFQVGDDLLSIGGNSQQSQLMIAKSDQLNFARKQRSPLI